MTGKEHPRCCRSAEREHEGQRGFPGETTFQTRRAEGPNQREVYYRQKELAVPEPERQGTAEGVMPGEGMARNAK